MSNRSHSSIPIVLAGMIAALAVSIVSIIGLFTALPWWAATVAVLITVRVQSNGRVYAIITNETLQRWTSHAVIIGGVICFFFGTRPS